MKILQVVHGFPPDNNAGTEIYTYNLAQELSKRNKIVIFYRVNHLREKDYYLWHDNYNGLETYAINSTFRDYHSFKDTYLNNSLDQRFCKILDQVKPDLVHIQNLLYLSTSLIDRIKERSIPIIVTLHDYWLICPQGQLLRSDLNICAERDYTQCYSCVPHHLSIRKNTFKYYYFLRRAVPEWFLQLAKNTYLKFNRNNYSSALEVSKMLNQRVNHMRQVCRKIDLFIAPSEFLRNKFLQFGIPNDKIILLKYGFNFENFKDKQKTPSDKLRFAFIGNIMPAKGLHILIEAFNRINSSKVELKIYGKVSSYKGLLEDYLNRIRKLIKNKSIKFAGEFDNQRISNIFKEIDVLVIPSLWQENSPLVIQEAFLSKTVPLASKVGGIPELIEDQKNGLLFEVNNVDSLYQKLKMIINNPDLLMKLKENITLPENIQKIAFEMEGLYKKLI